MEISLTGVIPTWLCLCNVVGDMGLRSSGEPDPGDPPSVTWGVSVPEKHHSFFIIVDTILTRYYIQKDINVLK